MIIVVEGPDKGGKSTLVKKLRERCPEARFLSMLGGRTEDAEVVRRRTYESVWEYCHEHGENALMTERFHPISDEVYRTVFGGRRIFSKHEYDGLCRSLARSSRVIYCRPRLETAIAAAHVAAGDDTEDWVNKVMLNMKRLFEEYDRVMLDLAWNRGVQVVNYDYESSVAPLIEESICAALR